MGTCPGLDHSEWLVQVFGLVWNRTDLFLQSKLGPLVGYPHPLLTLLRDVLEYPRNPHCGQPFLAQTNDDWGYKGSRRLLRYDQIVLLGGILIQPANELLYYRQPFNCPISVEHLGLHCKVDYTDANQRIMPESHDICVRHVKVTLITPSKAEFILFLYHALAGLCKIRSSNLRSLCLCEIQYWPFPPGAWRLNNGYWVLRFKNMQWWFQQCTMICLVELIVQKDSSGLSNRLIRRILYLLEQLFDRHICYKRMLYQLGSIV